MSEGQSPTATRLERALRIAWWMSIAAPLVLIVWMMRLGNSYALLDSFGAMVVDRDPMLWNKSMVWIAISIAMALIGACGSIVGYGLGAAKWRSVRVLLVWMAMVAVWFGTFARRHDIAWWGVWCRARVQLASLETFAVVSERHWSDLFPDPFGRESTTKLDLIYDRSAEGVASLLQQLGPNNVYTNRDTTIVMFGRGAVPGTHFEIPSIERTEGKAMRLELSGSDSGYWLERRWDAELPHSFSGGLNAEYVLQ
ncbi:MAG: hypothetical protein ACK5OB_01230, partial [Pirellula sp.]